MNKIKSIALSFICILAVNTSADAAGKPVKALDAFSWSAAEWISAANAPVMDLVVNDTQNCLAAEGASWFLSEVKNDKKVRSAAKMLDIEKYLDYLKRSVEFRLGREK